ncbi:MAG: hypothetical protein C4567_14435 [Deltaproteobacteria bacterium]|nr:MAG: hypothetical protein C4567_14435 [Deltaproteobacteria bacterium]
MSVKPQILAAISGAISSYLADEEAAAQALALSAAARALPAPPANLWGMAGRAEAMQMRMLMQRRSLK